MKYPGLPAVGRDPSLQAWNQAGENLDQAANRLAAVPESGARVEVMRSEVARRAGRLADARRHAAKAHVCANDDQERSLAHFTSGTLAWHVGDSRIAADNYAAVLRYGEVAGDRPTVLMGALGLLRARRVNLDGHGLTDSSALVGEALELGDDDLVADALRESAAWHLMRGLADEAGVQARRAADVHESARDDYLLGCAEVLLARALKGGEQIDSSLELLRSVRLRALRLHSPDLELQVVVYLGQFLQRGVGPDSPRWAEACDVLETALARSQDPVTEAEIWLPLAQLWWAAGRLDDTAEALRRYELLYASAGGNLVAEANAAKLRARLDLARAQAMPYGAFTRPIRVASAALRTRRLFRSAVTLYRRAGLPTAAVSVRWELNLVDAVTSGNALTAGMPDSLQSRDPLLRARDAFIRGKSELARGREGAAARYFEVAERAAIDADAGLLVVAAAGQLAEAASRSGDHDRARRAVRDAVRRAERFRGAVDHGDARRRIAATVRTEYERAALLSHELDDPQLVLEVAERLRTEQVTALLTRRSRIRLPPQIADVLDEIDAANEELARRAAPGGAALLRGLPKTLMADVDEPELRRRLEAARQRMSALTSDAFSELYDAPPTSLSYLLEGLTTNMVAILPIGRHGAESGEQILSVWRNPDGGCESTLTHMTDRMSRLRRRLTSSSYADRISLTERDLEPLRAILPAGLVRRLINSPHPLSLLVIPAGWLWSVPWAALPLGNAGPRTGRLLDRANLIFTPSLRMRRAANLARSARAATNSVDVASYALPTMRSGDLEALAELKEQHVSLDADPQPGRALLHRSGDRAWNLAVLATHGNREPGLAQALIDERGTTLLAAAHFLDASTVPPRRLVMAACHALCPSGDDLHEPLGLAVCALASGVEEICSAHVEIDFGTDLPARILADTYRGMDAGRTMSESLAHAQRTHMDRAPVPLVRWAALAVLG